MEYGTLVMSQLLLEYEHIYIHVYISVHIYVYPYVHICHFYEVLSCDVNEQAMKSVTHEGFFSLMVLNVTLV